MRVWFAIPNAPLRLQRNRCCHCAGVAIDVAPHDTLSWCPRAGSTDVRLKSGTFTRSGRPDFARNSRDDHIVHTNLTNSGCTGQPIIIEAGRSHDQQLFASAMRPALGAEGCRVRRKLISTTCLCWCSVSSSPAAGPVPGIHRLFIWQDIPNHGLLLFPANERNVTWHLQYR